MKHFLVIGILATLAAFSSAQTSYFPALGSNNSSSGPYGAFTGLNQFQSGAVLGPTNFAGLSAGNFVGALNGTAVVVTDGTPGSPCTGGGSGALAVRLSNAWLCLPTTSGSTISIQTDGTPNISQTVLNFTDANGCTWSNPSAGVEEVNCSSGGGSVTGSGTNNTLPIWTGTSSLGNSQLSQSSISGGTQLSLNLARINLTNRNTNSTYAEFFCTSLCQGINLQAFASGSFPNANFLLSNSSGQAQITTSDVSGNGGNWTFFPGLNKVMSFPPVLFANMQAPPSVGWIVYCSNCSEGSNPCSTAGGTGSGAWAFSMELNGGGGTKWKCF